MSREEYLEWMRENADLEQGTDFYTKNNPCRNHEFTESCRQANRAEITLLLDSIWPGLYINWDNPQQRKAHNANPTKPSE